MCVFVLDVMFDGGNLAALHFFTSARPAHNFNDSAQAEKATLFIFFCILLLSLHSFPFILLSNISIGASHTSFAVCIL